MTTPADVERTVAAANHAAPTWAALTPADRARALTALADALDAADTELWALAREETNLAPERLAGELRRTTFQLRLLGEAAAEGSHLDARIDHADPAWPMGAPRPDLRRVNEPLGPVVVFAASNFPFAFSVAGGDTASALAAGCPVVIKTHPGHPRLSARTAEVLVTALIDAGAPAGTLGLVAGQAAGLAVLQHPAIRAAAFTGSTRAGRLLHDLAAARPEPIPFYGELGSLNPAFVTPAAAAERPDEIVAGFVASVAGSAGQLCTKPGLLFVPRDSGLTAALADADLPAPAGMLGVRLHREYVRTLVMLRGHDAVQVLVQGTAPEGDPVSPTLLVTSASRFRRTVEDLAVECFGPAALLVEYDDLADLPFLASLLGGQLTATICATPNDDVADLVRLLATKAGRVVWNGWPTGVSVTHAQQHGGPYPASTAPASTSVGTAAIERFVRPVAYQDVPAAYLPAALRDDNPLSITRRIDGIVYPATAPHT